MRIAFYAPLKSPAHRTPSGDRRAAELYMHALRLAGHDVELVSEFCSLDQHGDARRQSEFRARGAEIAHALIERWVRGGRPDLWFTYHVYYKAPDWVGPRVARALQLPYVIAEGSYAPKRAEGPWAQGHAAAKAALADADLVLSPTRHDLECLRGVVSAERLVYLPPFLDIAPLRQARIERSSHRTRLTSVHGLNPEVPWIVVAAMMRHGDKLASYRELAAALALVSDLPWELLVAGDGVARAEVTSALERAVPERARYLGTLPGPELAGVYAAADLFVWPAVNEAYGMAMLEAQAAGIPVVSSALRGVPDVVCDGETGRLAMPGNPSALAALVGELLLDAGQREAMGRRAAEWVERERSIAVAAARLRAALENIGIPAGSH